MLRINRELASALDELELVAETLSETTKLDEEFLAAMTKIGAADRLDSSFVNLVITAVALEEKMPEAAKNMHTLLEFSDQVSLEIRKFISDKQDVVRNYKAIVAKTR